MLTLEIMAGSTTYGVLLGAVLDMVAWTILDLLAVDSNSTMAIQATDLGIKSWRD